MSNRPDFCGYVTRNDILCSDGRIIKKDAFKECDGTTVPLVWNHNHESPDAVIGHADLFNRPDGVYGECYLNPDVEYGKTAKALVNHGDITGLSIYANKLKHSGQNVIHGVIREVSLVLAGANPGAFIQPQTISHGDDGSETVDEAVIFMGENLELYHSEEKEKKLMTDDKEKKDVPDPQTDDQSADDSNETVRDVFNTLTEKQKKVVYALIGAAIDDAGEDDDDEEKEDMKHNVFESQNNNRTEYLSHADQAEILNIAKNPSVGSFKNALDIFAENTGTELVHDAISSGFIQDPQTDGNVTWLFPEYKDVRPGAPELLTNDQGWITVVLNKVHKSPISRIRTSYVDIRNIEGAMNSLRGRGYQKGKQKLQTGNFKLVRRTTDPQTIYVKSALHRDDIIDITDFDYVQYLYNIDRMNLNEELAMAIMLGDFRQDSDADKIFPEHIRPIWTDDDLYTMHFDLDVADARARLQGTETGSFFGDNYVYAEALIEQCLYSREKFKGTGTPDFFMTPHMLNVMLLSRDRNGRRIFGSKAELASALNVGNIYTAEQFADRVRKDDDNANHKLLGLIVNLADYSLGSTKGGEITHFTQFDIDFNQQKSLLETRCSGALTRVYSAIAIEEPVTTSGTGTTDPTEH